MIEINLVPDVKQELIKARMVRSAVVSGAIVTTIVAVSIVAILAAYVFGVQTARSLVADAAIKTGGDTLSKVDDLSKILTIQNQLTKINALNDAKPINSRIFNMLQAIIPPAPNQVGVSNIKIDAEAQVMTIDGVTPTYPSLEAFKKTIVAAYVEYTEEGDEKPTDVLLATDLSLSNVSFGEDASGTKVLRFTVSFTYAQELFASTIKNPKIVLINGGNVTDSYIGIPKSIFTDKATDTGASN